MSKFFLKVRFCFQFPFDFTSLPLKAINLKGHIYQNNIKEFHKFRKLKFIPLITTPPPEKSKPIPEEPPIPKRISEIIGRYSAGRGRVRYSCKVGDHFEENDIVMEIETNKACLNITAPSTGTLRQILVKDGERVRPGKLLFKLEKDDD